MKKTIILFLILLSGNVYSQTGFQENLNGFKLGQYRTCTSNEFGIPFQKEKFDDGFEYEIYLLRPDTTLYMIFEYPSYDTNIIWSAQIYGSDYDPHFLDLRLGDSKQDVISKTGSPDSIIDIGKYGVRWEYTKRNYSFEINPAGKLSSIKVMNKSNMFFPEIEPEKAPGFLTIMSKICSGDRRSLFDFIAPDIELYKDESVYSLEYSFDNEINNDRSGLFSKLFESSEDLAEIQLIDSTDYRFNIRVMEKSSPMWVIKFSEKHKIEELVFRYQYGRYLLYEALLRKE